MWIWKPGKGGAAIRLEGHLRKRLRNGKRGAVFYSTDLYHFSPHPSFISGREIKKRKCLFGLHVRIPPPVEPPTGDGAPTRSLVQGAWGNSQGINLGVNIYEDGEGFGVVREGAGGIRRPLTASLQGRAQGEGFHVPWGSAGGWSQSP